MEIEQEWLRAKRHRSPATVATLAERIGLTRAALDGTLLRRPIPEAVRELVDAWLAAR
jgi:hypothetical protein